MCTPRDCAVRSNFFGRASLTLIGAAVIRNIPGRRAELLSFQVFRRRDAAALARDDRAGWLVVDHEYGFERGVWLSVTKLDERVDIAEADIIGAGGDAIDWLKRTVSRLNRHLEFFRGEIAPVYRDQKGRGRPFELPIKCELDGGLRASRACHQCCREQPEGHAPSARPENTDNAHARSVRTGG